MKIEDAVKRLMTLGLTNEQFGQAVVLVADIFDEIEDVQQLESIRQKGRERAARRRARSDVNESEWYSLRREIFARDGERCAYCGRTEGPFHIDHVVPLFRGGDSAASNLVVACGPCNASKGNKLLSEWVGRL